MKRHLTYFLAAFLAVISFGCSSDEVGQPKEMELTIQLTMASRMDTRSPRPLEGVDAWQHVKAVRVYVFRADKENGTYTIYQPKYYYDGESKTLHYIDVEAFKEKTGIYKDENPETHTVVINPNLPDGYYRLLAIGVDENETLFDLIKEDSTWDDIVHTFEGPIYEEFFSGYSEEPVHISSSIKKTHISIELKRCVAGVLLYAKNFPSNINYIRLVLSGYSKTTDIVNRTWKSDAEISEVELARFEAKDITEILIKKKDGTEEKVERYLFGQFLIPSNTSILTNPTMQMVFYDSKGLEKRKNVVLVYASDNDYGNPDLSVDKQGTHYNILANHIYCIGVKSDVDDDPIDLSDDSDEVKIIAFGSWQDDVDITL